MPSTRVHASNTSPEAIVPPAWEAAAEALLADGIAVAPELFESEADYLKSAYIEGTTTPLVPQDRGIAAVSLERGAATGNPAWVYVSLTDPILFRLVLHPGLLGVIQRYYESQPYLRRMPYVKRTHIEAHHVADISSVYHIDQGKHFVSIMMLLSDLTESDSHMRFLKGTHRIEQADFRFKPNDPRNKELDVTLESKHPIFNLIGKKGTMFIYDNGNGIHKGNMVTGTTRDVMQATYSRGDHTTKPADHELLADVLKAWANSNAPIVREAITRIV